MFFGKYSLRKCRHILYQKAHWFQKKEQRLSEKEKKTFREKLKALKEAIEKKERPKARQLAKELSEIPNRSFVFGTFELALALLVALLISIPIRLMWFELYEIPTGSMRPTFREKDRLTVSKTDFGINIPLKKGHFYFDSNLVQRTSAIIFSGKGIPALDETAKLLYLVPYTKRYVKRLMGKPGDSIYFYGGKLYVVDKEGNWIKAYLEAPWMEKVESIPFLQFEGDIKLVSPTEFQFLYARNPIGRLQYTPFGKAKGETFDGEKWVSENIRSYSDFYGIKNYAMAQLFTKEELQKDPELAGKDVEEGVLYLVLYHTPNFQGDTRIYKASSGGYHLRLPTHKSVIPLKQDQLETLMNNLYTARFVIKNGKGYRYHYDSYAAFDPYAPSFPGIPDGTYEFYFGKASKVGFQGISFSLPKNHPLYKKDPRQIQKLFNMGIDMSQLFQPSSPNVPLIPHRYAYFRNGDLYLMGAPLLKKENPNLQRIEFKDHGPPIKEDRSLDIEFVRTFGITVPEKHYFVLGDNPSMSADSRVFGFVSEDNLEGAPSLIIWPPGERFGSPDQQPYPWVTFPRLMVWSLAFLILMSLYLNHLRKKKNCNSFLEKL